ncbi:Phosphate regulon transcriptional regulatory protein phoB,DNA-binding transcriptional regulator BasR,phosphate regulon transcriptional regulatory protein PhoB,Transcriptional regulatory protein, C terminal [Chlamydia poikilotherma]|uniref:Phosphate regulon transcriptional regulatory protein phoB,DNA-binding transcriptional regulator BasR,phosphate regulon transcriptional regulatory protein PhoB,Transcriptional regulatory protein, C... n=1 Tax=Chlamydia poikilotherma TaxID=1967783 RepID=A0A3B0Q9A3_9CHLA|nr:response regulator transcription factor [Chlamydia poikilotherma]SYX09467.1 Phosphate regulon transcriptional regulatory protein phoB,DNA-binding transcriptional regulator BasR,phosphate regulon transcriptional regulatory protein PhoB,Transcriptional regulatory protein, C terminal [Chlamydia poikilotherma]
MLTDKIILFVTEDSNISLQLKEFAQNVGYKIIVSSALTDTSEADLIFCEHLLLPEVMFANKIPSGIDLVVLFDVFEEEAIVKILNNGASGYLLRPITAKVLDAVIGAFLRHHCHFEHAIPESISFGDRTFHLLSLSIDSPQGTIHLTPSEAGILKKLLMNRGQLCLRKHLLEEIKGNTKEIIARNVDVHIASLRKKLGPYGSKISTIRGVGYLFSENDNLTNSSTSETTTIYP